MMTMFGGGDGACAVVQTAVIAAISANARGALDMRASYHPGSARLRHPYRTRGRAAVAHPDGLTLCDGDSAVRAAEPQDCRRRGLVREHFDSRAPRTVPETARARAAGRRRRR